MARALDVTMTFDPASGSDVVYALQVDEFVVNIRRTPYNQAMYGTDPVQHDFGLSDPTVRIRGVIPTVAPGYNDGGVTIAHKDALEDAITDDFADTITLTLGAGTGASTTSVYEGNVSDVSFTLIPGKEQQYWTFTLTLLSKFRD